MARRGEELKRRIEGKQVAGDQDEEEESESESESGDDDEFGNGSHEAHGRLQRLYEAANALDSDAQGSKLASMDFMRRAEAARKARNDSDAEALFKELAGEEMPSEEEPTEGQGRQSFGRPKDKAALSGTTKNSPASQR